MIKAAQRRDPKEIMSSTFRGRGKDTAGSIFRPALERVDYVRNELGNKPVRFHFVFHEVLVPELVRAQGTLGDVFNLLYVATRVRWEVLYPSLIKPWLRNNRVPCELDGTREEQVERIAKIVRSLRLIELQTERHDMTESIVKAFDVEDRQTVMDLLDKRGQIKEAIARANDGKNYGALMEVLKSALKLNCDVMDLLVGRFHQLVSEDNDEVRNLLSRESGGKAPSAVPAAFSS